MTGSQARILVIDDDQDVLTALRLLLKREFDHVITNNNPERLHQYLRDTEWDVILLDMNFELGANSGIEGLDWLGRILSAQAGTPVILMTAYGDVDTAVQAIKRGAVDFVLKPWQNEKLVSTVSAALLLKASRKEVQLMRDREREMLTVEGPAIVGQSLAFRHVLDTVKQVASTEASVLILGENGTGKEVIAGEIHKRSLRREQPMIRVDLGSVAESLFESELFGHRKGAFTGATADRIGRFQAASGGTLFLDEIGNLPLHLQGKLLSVIEQRTVLPLGSNSPVPIDVRLLCATNMSLRQMVAEGKFREDLLYRINTVELTLPPLRSRAQDIRPLLEHFLELYARKYNRDLPHVPQEVFRQLEDYSWPGNVRELRHAVERAVIMNRPEALVPQQQISSSHASSPNPDEDTPLNLELHEKRLLEQALRKHSGNISQAAKALGITRTSLYRRMEKHGL